MRQEHTLNEMSVQCQQRTYTHIHTTIEFYLESPTHMFLGGGRKAENPE